MISPGALASSPAVRPFYSRSAAVAPPAAPPTFVSTTTQSASDPFRLGFTLDLFPTIAAGDLLVVAVSQRSGNAFPNTPAVTIDGGGAPVVTLAAATLQSTSVDTFIFYITGAAAGVRSVLVTPAGIVGVNTPTGMACVVYVLRGAAAAPLDKTATNEAIGDVGPFVCGPTAALTVANQFDIVALGLGILNDGSEVPEPWVAPFVARTHDGGVVDATTDVTLWVADRTSLTNAAVTATSSGIPDATDFAVALATFKGA